MEDRILNLDFSITKKLSEPVKFAWFISLFNIGINRFNNGSIFHKLDQWNNPEYKTYVEKVFNTVGRQIGTITIAEGRIHEAFINNIEFPIKQWTEEYLTLKEMSNTN